MSEKDLEYGDTAEDIALQLIDAALKEISIEFLKITLDYEEDNETPGAEESRAASRRIVVNASTALREVEAAMYSIRAELEKNAKATKEWQAREDAYASSIRRPR